MRCQSCKYWGLNRDLALNGIGEVHIIDAFVHDVSLAEQWQAYCENTDVRKAIRVRETSLPKYIKPIIQKWFTTSWTFGCTNWEEAEGWEALWK